MGRLGFITPETFIRTSTYSEIRQYLINNIKIENIDIYGNGIFENVTAETIALILQKCHDQANLVHFRKHSSLGKISSFQEKQEYFKQTEQNRFVYGSNKTEKSLFDKIKSNKINLGEVVDVRNGIATKSGKNSFISDSPENENYKKLLEAPDLYRYGFNWPKRYINYNRELLHRPRKEETFLSEKILIQRVSPRLVCSFDNEKFYTFNSINNLILKNEGYDLKTILGILNSKLMDFFYRRNYSLNAGYTITVTKANLDSLPIPILKNNEASLGNILAAVNFILGKSKEFQQAEDKFVNYLKSTYFMKKPSKKLQFWHELEFGGFIKELNKGIKASNKVRVKEGFSPVPELSKKDEFEWMELFEENKQKTVELQREIEKTDREIDAMVYELYGLTEEEIGIVEESMN